jgi:hypothetical protein
MMFTAQPGRQLIAVVRAAGMTGLALRIDGQKLRRRCAQIGDQTIGCSHARFELAPQAGVAHGLGISLNRHAAVVEEFSKIAATGQNVP